MRTARWFSTAKSGGKCMNDGKGMDIVKNFTCISSEGEPMSPKALGDDLQDYEPQAENANYYQIEDNSVQTQDI